MKLPLAASLIVIEGRGGNAFGGPKMIRGLSKQSDFVPRETPTAATQEQQRRRPVYIGYCVGCASLYFEAPANGSPSLTLDPQSSSVPSVSEPPANVKSESPQQEQQAMVVDKRSWVTDGRRGRIIPTLDAPLLLAAPVAKDSMMKDPKNDDERRMSRDKKRKRPRAVQADSSSEADRATENAHGEAENNEATKILASIVIYIVVLAAFIIGPRSSQRDKDLDEFDDIQLELSPTDDSKWADEDEAEEATVIVAGDDDNNSVPASATCATRGMVREQGVRVSFASEVEVVVLPTLAEEDDDLEAIAHRDIFGDGVEVTRSKNQDCVDNEDETYDTYERFLDEVNYSVGNF